MSLKEHLEKRSSANELRDIGIRFRNLALARIEQGQLEQFDFDLPYLTGRLFELAANLSNQEESLRALHNRRLAGEFAEHLDKGGLDKLLSAISQRIEAEITRLLAADAFITGIKQKAPESKEELRIYSSQARLVEHLADQVQSSSEPIASELALICQLMESGRVILGVSALRS